MCSPSIINQAKAAQMIQRAFHPALIADLRRVRIDLRRFHIRVP
jgi:hypothetical protein